MRYTSSIIIVFIVSHFTFATQLKIGVLLDDTLATRWQVEKRLFQTQIKAHGAIPILKICDGDPKIQYTQAKELISSDRVDVLIIVANDGNMMSEIVTLANKNNIITIAYDRMIPNCPLDYYISFDAMKIGEKMAEGMLKKQPKGNYVIISGPKKDNNSLLIHEGEMKALKPAIERGDVKILLDHYEIEWLDMSAFSTMVDYIQDNSTIKIDAVLVANDNMAGGVIEALEMMMIENVQIAGQDAEMAALKRIEAGRQALTIHKPITHLLDLCVLVATSKNVKTEKILLDTVPYKNIDNGDHEVLSYVLEPILITSENVEETIETIKLLK